MRSERRRAREKLDSCPIPGRFDVARTDPLVLVDACHNPQSCENFVRALNEVEPCMSNRPALLIAALSDKDVSGIVDVLVPAFPQIVIAQTASDRAMPAGELADLVRAKLGELGRDEGDVLSVFEDVASALDWATASGLELVAAGTITLAGEVAGLLRG